MIDFSKIKITEEKLGQFGDVQIKAELKLESRVNLNPDSYFQSKSVVEATREKVKQELYFKVYGDLNEPINYLLKLVNDYVLPSMNYQRHPWFVNEKEIKENIEKLQKLLENPK